MNVSIKKLAPGIIISCFCLGIMLYQINLSNVWLEVRKASFGWLILGILSLNLGYILRIIRWHLFLKTIKTDLLFKECINPYLASITLNNCLPFRAGDVIRAFFFPKKMGLSNSLSLNSIILERILDIATLCAMALISFYFVAKWNVPWIMPLILLCAFVFLVVPLLFIFKNKIKDVLLWLVKNKFWTKLSFFFLKMLEDMSLLIRTPILIKSFILTLLLWFFEIGIYHYSFLSLNQEIGLSSLIFIFAAATLSTLIPSTPGYVGTFHLAIYLSAQIVDIEKDMAAAYSIIIHGLLWLSTTIPGLISIIFQPWKVTIK
jgi:uncharacterized protein (TIRG00374 family)